MRIWRQMRQMGRFFRWHKWGMCHGIITSQSIYTIHKTVDVFQYSMSLAIKEINEKSLFGDRFETLTLRRERAMSFA